MADFLVKCKVCGGQVSNKARICPHCGKRLKISLGLKIFIGIVLLSSILVVMAFPPPSGLGLFSTSKNQNSSKNNAAGKVTIKNHEFVLGKDTYHQNLTLFINEWGLSANKVNQNSEIVNNIYSVRERAYINLQYLDGDNRIRVIEFHYDLNNVLQGFKLFEFDGSPQGAIFGGIADRTLPIGPDKITVPGPKKEDRKQTRYVAGIETQTLRSGGYVYQYCWTSDLNGLSYLGISKSRN